MSSDENITPPTADRPRERYVGKNLTSLARMARAYVDPCVAPFGLSFTLVQILIVLFEGDGISQHEVGCQLHFDKGAMARAIKKLEDDGYVTREQHPTDERAYRVLLTDRARREEPAIRAILRGWTAGATRGLSEEEFSQLADLLARMIDNAAEMLRCPAPPLPPAEEAP
jgi:DNA-binding MarR family transcriptional regulator